MKKSIIGIIAVAVALILVGALFSPTSENEPDAESSSISEVIQNSTDNENEPDSTTSTSRSSETTQNDTESTNSTASTTATVSSTKTTVASRTTKTSVKKVVTATSSKPQAKETSNDNTNNSQTVYITETGKKYHSRKNCPGLSRAKAIYESTLSEAKALGLEPCSKCY